MRTAAEDRRVGTDRADHAGAGQRPLSTQRRGPGVGERSWGSRCCSCPSYSPNLNLIERLWKFIKRRALYGRYHPTFADFQAAIQEILDGLPTTHAEQLKTLMTLNFQRFEDVSLMAA